MITLAAYAPIRDPAAMFTLAGMSAALSLFLLIAVRPSLQSWFWLLTEVLRVNVKENARVNRLTLGGFLPIPFALVAVGSFVLGVVALVTR